MKDTKQTQPTQAAKILEKVDEKDPNLQLADKMYSKHKVLFKRLKDA